MEWADNFTGLQHIGIPTNDMDKTVEFYKKIGFEVAHETKDGDVRVVFLKFRDLILETYENKEAADTCICVPGSCTADIQELHLPVYHALCAMLEERFFE